MHTYVLDVVEAEDGHRDRISEMRERLSIKVGTGMDVRGLMKIYDYLERRAYLGRVMEDLRGQVGVSR